MFSIRQIQANQRNAQLSTGPKSVEGKAVVSVNALKTGLDASAPIGFVSQNPHQPAASALLTGDPSRLPAPAIGVKIEILDRNRTGSELV